MQGPRKQVTAFAGYGTVNKTPLQGRDIRTRSINGTRNYSTSSPFGGASMSGTRVMQPRLGAYHWGTRNGLATIA